jgi:hypothetical protein
MKSLDLARRALRKPPRVVVRRLLQEARTELDRVAAPRRGRRFDDRALLAAVGAASIDELWGHVLDRPFPFVRGDAELAEIERRWPEERERVLAAAEQALGHHVDVLGTGPVELGDPIDWHRDWKTERRWPLRYGPRLEYAELDRSSDVKVPWEISRLQWVLPLGQAFLLTGDERYAQGARRILDDWIAGNPYALGVNWAIAMEPALRTLSLAWLVYACGRSAAWRDGRGDVLRALYLHLEFVERHIERAAINGNHYTADASALAFGGLVLGVDHWTEMGWTILVDELPRQVHPDGVDFEASSAYHRLVGELFALPAILRRAHGLTVGDEYTARLEAMARFTEAYTGPDGLAPLWGDADDGRALPLGSTVNDHRSLPVLARSRAAGNAEAAWLVGPDAVVEEWAPRTSAAFADGGAYVLRSGGDHVFIDCGPVGLAGRGGHGHNDCLSFEATLDGERLISDSGSYVYTASAAERNRFRATGAHNTPLVDGAEQNRIPESLWQLENDALPERLLAEPFCFRGSHTGYLRLPSPVRPIRTITLDPEAHALTVVDELEGEGEHDVEIPYHLAPGIEPELHEHTASLGRFVLRWQGDWTPAVEDSWVSPSYGVRVPSQRIVFRRSGSLSPLTVTIAPR